MQALERYLSPLCPASYAPLAQDSVIRKLKLNCFCIRLSFSKCADAAARSTGEQQCGEQDLPEEDT